MGDGSDQGPQHRYGHWESYYRQGALTTSPMGDEENYSLELREVWESFFSSLGQGSTIADLATGNGAIALIAKESAERLGRQFEIHGIDAAAIDPATDVADGARRFAGIRFHPTTPAEKLPFAAASVHAVCGQFGLEYTDTEATLQEIARVLLPGGTAQFICHHRDSVIVRNAHESLRLVHAIFNEMDLLGRVGEFIAAERSAAPDLTQRKARLEEGAARLDELISESANPLLAAQLKTALAQLFAQRGSLTGADLAHALAHIDVATHAAVARMTDLVQAAWSGD